MLPADALRLYIGESAPKPRKEGRAFAPSNIALCKYWGKRQRLLNLPTHGSISINLGKLGSFTRVKPIVGIRDIIILNGHEITPETSFFKRATNFCDLFRQFGETRFLIETTNNIPTKAGLASSASGFAALTLALARFYRLPADIPMLSRIARLGSGSACRSFYKGFCEWICGKKEDGTDSFAVPLHGNWSDLRIGLLDLISTEKEASSRKAMDHISQTSQFYKKWIEKSRDDLVAVKKAIEDRDFIKLGEIAEHNALKMHATMISSWPPISYWQEKTLAIMRKIWEARRNDVHVYFTLDAGPNVKLLFTQGNEQTIREIFAGIIIINPFEGPDPLELW